MHNKFKEQKQNHRKLNMAHLEIMQLLMLVLKHDEYHINITFVIAICMKMFTS